jgi:predicted phage-related endonuclease
VKKSLILTPTKGMSREDWLAYRQSGLGASEVGAVLGLDEYMSSLELFYHKIGETAKFDFTSLQAFMGREEEPLLAKMWQHWDGDEQGMINNYLNGIVVQKCQRVNAFVRNPEFPWLFVSLDRKINKTQHRGEGALELKTITSWEADKWISGIPPKWVPQLQTQILVCEFGFGELGLCQDRRHFNVLPFDPSENIRNHIIQETKQFWDRVLEARKLVNEKYLAQIQYNQARVDELNHQIDALAPEPDGTLAYGQFLAERFNEPNLAERMGSLEELAVARLQLLYGEEAKAATEKKILQENRLKAALGDHQILNFGQDGKVYWTKNEAGGRTFRNRVHVDKSVENV